MILDVSRFKNAIPSIQAIYEKQKHAKSLELIVVAASPATHVHIIATAYIVAKLHGSMTKELQDQIDRCKAFYGVVEVIGIEDL